VDSGGYNIVDSGRNLNTLNSGVPLLTLYQAAMKTWLFPSSPAFGLELRQAESFLLEFHQEERQ
jgi:hypothetical protein